MYQLLLTAQNNSSKFYLSASYPLQSYGNPSLFAPSIHLDDVDCDGTESMLSECSHQGIGIHNCVEGDEEAGVICTSKFNKLPRHLQYFLKILLKM